MCIRDSFEHGVVGQLALNVEFILIDIWCPPAVLNRCKSRSAFTNQRRADATRIGTVDEIRIRPREVVSGRISENLIAAGHVTGNIENGVSDVLDEEGAGAGADGQLRNRAP